MDNRRRFIDYVKNGGSPICSPQIGAGAGFDTKMAGKEWVTQTSIEDTIAVVEQFDIVPLITAGLCDFGACNPELIWKQIKCEQNGDRISGEYAFETPYGTLERKVIEDKIKGCFAEKYPVQDSSNLDALEYYIDAAIACDLTEIERHVRNVMSMVAGRSAVCIQWPVQPYELWCFPDTVTTVMLAYDCPEQFKRLMDKIVILDERLMRAVAAGGADFIFLGGPAAEMISPRYYEDYIIPYSQQVTDIAHALGLLVYSHICSPIEPFLTMGFYNRMGIDLFETLSPPPVGNVASLTDAMKKIDPSICTRGNLDLEVLLNGSPELVREKTIEILESTMGRKHIVAASDYLFYGVPAENVHTMAETVKEYNGWSVSEPQREMVEANT
ncbi:MAG: uroporphyrinogen decarboxylase family protein [Armatimonadota bacterium]|nr:uroporphyrinogen decarboxylase family protein [bacterium]